MSRFVKVEKEEYETIPNLSADVKQERMESMDANVNYSRREKYESLYWQQKCEDSEQKVRRLENEITSLKSKQTPKPQGAPKAAATTPYSDPLLKAFFCPKLPETEFAEWRKEKKEMIATLAKMKDENIQLKSTIEEMSRRLNVANNPELADNRKLMNQLQMETRQNAVLKHQLDTVSSQLRAQINKEVHIRGVQPAVQPAVQALPKTKKNKKLQNKIQSLEGQLKKLKTQQKSGAGLKDQSLKSANRILTGEVNRLKTQVKTLESQINSAKDGLKQLLGDIPSKVSLKFEEPETVPGLLNACVGDFELLRNGFNLNLQ